MMADYAARVMKLGGGYKELRLMNAFRAFLILIFGALGAYTVATGFRQGWNLLPIFFGDIAALTWPGQFNCDFLCFLLLSGLWLSWRHHFSLFGLFLGVAGVFGGMMLLAPYLLYASIESKGDARMMLLGKRRTALRAS